MFRDKFLPLHAIVDKYSASRTRKHFYVQIHLEVRPENTLVISDPAHYITESEGYR